VYVVTKNWKLEWIIPSEIVIIKMKDGKVLATKGKVSDCGQSIVQFGGDDMTGICLGMDMAIFGI
jgi:hypothetical protein